ncbi:MAG TPA: GerMN domain-containing protein [Mobilitalea sp.]|nr:GerMN domain-containing protein [Mobilitalea sp.]
MKKVIMPLMVVLMIAIMSGCGKTKQNTEISNTVTPSVQPTVTQPAANTTENTQENTTAQALKLEDYYPLLADTEYIYTGAGNEYASYTSFTDFLDGGKGRIQTRTNNGGTETVRVMEIKDGKLSVIKKVNECYYRENFIENAAAGEDAEVLLMEPLVQGTQWTLSDGSKRYISAIDVNVDTPTGNYKAIEVTTEGTDSTTKDYYAPQTGLIKSVYGSGDMEVTSTLSEIHSNTPFTQNIDIYYPASDEKIYVEPLTLTFHTGDDTKLVLQNAICAEAAKDNYLPLASINTKINSLYLGDDKIVHIDFSSELVTDMNAGAGYELLILQSITNTLGSYYGAQEVVITVAGKPYESGHVLMKEGETFKVNMDKVVR